MKKYDEDLFFKVYIWFDDGKEDGRFVYFPSESQLFKFLHYWLINADVDNEHFSISVKEYEDIGDKENEFH